MTSNPAANRVSPVSMEVTVSETGGKNIESERKCSILNNTDDIKLVLGLKIWVIVLFLKK